MGRKKGGKNKISSRRRFSTPPPDLCPQDQKHLKTPVGSAILGAVYYAELNGNSTAIPQLAFAFRCTERIISRILNKVEPRRQEHRDKPDPRGPHRQFTEQNTVNVSDWFDKTLFEEKEVL